MNTLPSTSTSPGGLTAVTHCSGSDRPIHANETYYRYNGRSYCAEEARRMFPEVLDARVRTFNAVMGYSGLVGPPLLAGIGMFVALQTGLSPGRAGGVLALLVVGLMYASYNTFLGPAVETKRLLEKVEPGRRPARL